jgi:predicted nucleic acid-binding protein
VGNKLIVDASVVIASLLPDEPYRDAALSVLTQFSDTLELLTVPLLRYEVANAVWKALKAGRVKLEDALEVLREFEALNIPEGEVSSVEALKLAHTYNPRLVGLKAQFVIDLEHRGVGVGVAGAHALHLRAIPQHFL